MVVVYIFQGVTIQEIHANNIRIHFMNNAYELTNINTRNIFTKIINRFICRNRISVILHNNSMKHFFTIVWTKKNGNKQCL